MADATVVKSRMDAIAGYLDRLYAPIQFHGKTCGTLASFPGFPVWIDVNGSVNKGVWVGGRESGYQGAYLWTPSGWEQRNTGLSATAIASIRYIAPCPHDPNIVLLTADDGVWRTTDQGENWSQITMPVGVGKSGFRGIGWDTENPGLVLVAGPELESDIQMHDPRVERSTNYGESFTSLPLPHPASGLSGLYNKEVGRVAIHAGKAIVTCDSGIIWTMPIYWHSEDAGQTWNYGWMGDSTYNIDSTFEGLAPYFGTPGKFRVVGDSYNGYDSALTEDTGGTFTFDNQAPAEDYAGYRQLVGSEYGDQMVFDRVHGRLWLASGLGVHLSPDFGDTWTRLANISDGCYIRGIAVNQLTGTVFVSLQKPAGGGPRDTGTYASDDAGDTWTRLGSTPVWGYGMASSYADWPGTRKVGTRAMGQYFGIYPMYTLPTTGYPHSVISHQPFAPAWVGPDTPGLSSDDTHIGMEDGEGEDFTAPAAVMARAYSAGSVQYALSNHPDQACETENKVEVYIGPEKVIDDVAALDPAGWSVSVTRDNDDYLRSLDYPPRHCFHLGKMFYAARGDTTKAQAFQNSIDETCFDHDIYDPLYGAMDLDHDDGYFFDWLKSYKDTTPGLLKGDQTTAVPQGIADDGCFLYPYESKLNAEIGGGPVIAPLFATFTRTVVYSRMLWMLHNLKKDANPYRAYIDPALGFLNRAGWTPIVSAVDIAEQAIAAWDSVDGLGMPGAISMPWQDPPAQGSNFINAVFASYMTVLGYGLGLSRYKYYADEAVDRICNSVWGVSPNATGKGYIMGVEVLRPHHQGGLMVIYENNDTPGLPVQVPELEGLSKWIEEYSVYDFHIPLYATSVASAVEVSTGIRRQKRQEPHPSPTNMEASTLCWMALRTYLAYKHNEAYPAGTWDNGLNLLSGVVAGLVTDDNGVAIADADVILVDGTHTENPQALTAYRRAVKTDENGLWTMPYEGAGAKTVYVVAAGYKHVNKTHTFAADQNVVFPTAALQV